MGQVECLLGDQIESSSGREGAIEERVTLAGRRQCEVEGIKAQNLEGR